MVFCEASPTRLPANAKLLSEIVKAVEDKSYKVIEEVEFDDGCDRSISLTAAR